MESSALEPRGASADVPAVIRWILGAPLWMKLVGTNALIVLAAIVAVRIASNHGDSFPLLERSLLGTLGAALVINLALVLVALRPLRTLERTVSEVRRGNTTARVPPSLLADRDMARVGSTLNLLVDTLVEDQARSRELAALVISQAELDQLRIAHELHESAAQQLAAQVMQISAIARDTSDTHTRTRLEEVRAMASDTLEHLRALARDIRPGVRSDISGRPGSRDDRASNRSSLSEAVRKW
jgi:two-component system sensor histidine kinase UhpB